MKHATFNLRQQAYDRIRELLRSGDLSPGDRISSLGLSKRLGISRTPVREALSKLCSDGVVKEVPGFGVLIHVPDENELRELYAMREVLECFAAREAALNITGQELLRLEELLLQWRGIAGHLRSSRQASLEARLLDRWIKIDEKFHEIVLQAARNQLLTKTVDDMRLTSRVLEARAGRDDLSLGPAAKTILDHTRLFRALQRRDPAAADLHMRRQLAIGRKRHIDELHRAQAQLD